MWPTDDGLQGLLAESLRDELEHHIWSRHIFRVEHGRAKAYRPKNGEDAQMRLRREWAEQCGFSTLVPRRWQNSQVPELWANNV